MKKIFNFYIFIFITFNNVFGLSPTTHFEKDKIIQPEQISQLIETGEFSYFVNDVEFKFKIEPDLNELDDAGLNYSDVTSKQYWWKKHSFSIQVTVDGFQMAYVDADRLVNFYQINQSFDSAYSELNEVAIQVYGEWSAKYTGIGTALMSLALSLAKEAGVKEFRIKDGRLADKFYLQKFGFKEVDPELYVFDLVKQQIPYQNIYIEEKLWVPSQYPDGLVAAIQTLNDPIFSRFKMINGRWNVLWVKGERLIDWIVKVSDPDSPYFIDDYQFVKNILTWTIEISKSLHKLSKTGFKHGDLSITNVMINKRTLSPKLIDMDDYHNDLEVLPYLIYSSLTKRHLVVSYNNKMNVSIDEFEDDVYKHFSQTLIDLTQKKYSSFDAFIKALETNYNKTYVFSGTGEIYVDAGEIAGHAA